MDSLSQLSGQMNKKENYIGEVSYGTQIEWPDISSKVQFVCMLETSTWFQLKAASVIY